MDEGSGFSFRGSGFRVYCSGFRVLGFGFRVGSSFLFCSRAWGGFGVVRKPGFIHKAEVEIAWVPCVPHAARCREGAGNLRKNG